MSKERIIFNKNKYMKWRKLNVNEIKKDEWYKLPEIALMLDVHHSTLTRRCHAWKLEATNIGTEKKASFVVLWSNLLKYLNNK